MLTLYVKTGCPYCAKVLEKLRELNLPFEEKNIADPGVVEELKERGGKKQVPFMDDDNMTPYIVDDDVEMYESNNIVDYLGKKYAGSGEVTLASKAPVHLHRSDDSNTCDGCQ